MAQPLEPKLARSYVMELPPDVPRQTNGESAAHPSQGPNGGSSPAKPSFDPWPTTDSPPAQGDGKARVAVPAKDWEEPAADPPLSYGGYSEDGYVIVEETSDETPDNYSPMSASETADWEEETRALEQEIRMDLADSSPLFPVRRPLYKRPAPPPSAEEQLGSVIEFLQKLQRNVQNIASAPEEPSPAALGSTLLQLRRLSRTGVVPDPFEIGVLPRPPRIEIVPPAEALPRPESEGSERADEPGNTLPPRAEPARLQRHHVVWLVFTGGLCLVTLGLVAYVWTQFDPLSRVGPAPRNRVARATPGPAVEEEVSEEALNLAGLALEAMQRGDLKNASDILADAQKRGVTLPGLAYQAALLALNQGQGQEADNFLERSIRANEAVPECWYLRANTVFFSEGPAQAAEAFDQAVAAAPFSPRYYFFRAECLRRNGKAAAAVAQFQQALRCRPSSADTELILFKIGLTKLEMNADLIFKAELRDRLAQEPVSGDTLLLAAADAISRNEFAEAAALLKRAALILPPRVFQSRTRDYVYRAQEKQPDIAGALKLTVAAPPNGQPAQRPGRMLIDPATRSMAEADPGGW